MMRSRLSRLVLLAVPLCAAALWGSAAHNPFLVRQLTGESTEEVVSVCDSLVGTSWAPLEVNGAWARVPADTHVVVFHPSTLDDADTITVHVVGIDRRYGLRQVAEIDVPAGVTTAARFTHVRQGRRSGIPDTTITDSILTHVERVWVDRPDSGLVKVFAPNTDALIDSIPGLRYRAGAAVVQGGAGAEITYTAVTWSVPDTADVVEFQVRLYPVPADLASYEPLARRVIQGAGELTVPLGLVMEGAHRVELWAAGEASGSRACGEIRYTRNNGR